MKLQRVTLSGINTYKLPVLSAQETEDLFSKLKQGETNAKKELINGNLRLVLSVINKFKNRGENLDDLFQVGCVGLVKAVDNFDPNQKVKFSTYAVPMITGEIKRYLRDDNPMRVSRSLKLKGQEAVRIKEKLRKEKPHEPTVEEVAHEMNLSREEVVEALNSVSEPVSLYDPVYSDSTDPVLLVDQLEDEREQLDSWVENLTLKEALIKLPEKQQDIVSMRFFQGKTQMEVSQELEISQAQVSRLEKSALKILKQLMDINLPINEGKGAQNNV